MTTNKPALLPFQGFGFIHSMLNHEGSAPYILKCDRRGRLTTLFAPTDLMDGRKPLLQPGSLDELLRINDLDDESVIVGFEALCFVVLIVRSTDVVIFTPNAVEEPLVHDVFSEFLKWAKCDILKTKILRNQSLPMHLFVDNGNRILKSYVRDFNGERTIANQFDSITYVFCVLFNHCTALPIDERMSAVAFDGESLSLKNSRIGLTHQSLSGLEFVVGSPTIFRAVATLSMSLSIQMKESVKTRNLYQYDMTPVHAKSVFTINSFGDNVITKPRYVPGTTQEWMINLKRLKLDISMTDETIPMLDAVTDLHKKQSDADIEDDVDLFLFNQAATDVDQALVDAATLIENQVRQQETAPEKTVNGKRGKRPRVETDLRVDTSQVSTDLRHFLEAAKRAHEHLMSSKLVLTRGIRDTAYIAYGSPILAYVDYYVVGEFCFRITATDANGEAMQIPLQTLQSIWTYVFVNVLEHARDVCGWYFVKEEDRFIMNLSIAATSLRQLCYTAWRNDISNNIIAMILNDFPSMQHFVSLYQQLEAVGASNPDSTVRTSNLKLAIDTNTLQNCGKIVCELIMHRVAEVYKLKDTTLSSGRLTKHSIVERNRTVNFICVGGFNKNVDNADISDDEVVLIRSYVQEKLTEQERVRQSLCFDYDLMIASDSGAMGAEITKKYKQLPSLAIHRQVVLLQNPIRIVLLLDGGTSFIGAPLPFVNEEMLENVRKPLGVMGSSSVTPRSHRLYYGTMHLMRDAQELTVE